MWRWGINDKGCSHDDRVDASTPGHPRLPRQFIPYFLARRLARKYEKMSPQARLPLRLRHLIITVRPPTYIIKCTLQYQ